MTDAEKLTMAIAALEEIASQECHLRQGGCDQILDFEGLEQGLGIAVDAAQTALGVIVPHNP
jgi:hypothetical protein